MLSPRQLVAGVQVRRPAIAVPRLSEGAVLALGGFFLYLIVAAVLVFGFHHVIGDAWSRVTNAYYVLFSRDPHLAAIGFIWNPLPSLMAIPLLPLKAIFPPLTELGFISHIYGAAFMAGALYMAWGILFDLGVRRWMRLLIVAIFALHPMILQYGGNGMTEAPFIFLSLATIRYLSRWLMTGDLVPLVYAGIFLGIGYLVRYEAIAIGAATTLLVLGVGFLRASGTLRFRAKTALADAIVFAAPLALIFLLWAGVSWLIVGSPFEQFGSIYGTTAQLAADAENILYRETTGQVSPGFVVGHFLIMEPFFLVIGAMATVVAIWRREVRVLVILAVFGSVLAFEAWAFLTGKTGGWVRYYIVIIPMVVLLAGSILGRRADPPSWASLPPMIGRRLTIGAPGRPSGWRADRRERLSRVGTGVTAVVLAAMLIAAMPTTLAAMPSDRFGIAKEHANGVGRISASREIAATIDDLGLADSTVLVDVFLSFGIIVNSDHPRQFVITPDRDFKAILADPAAFDIQYILVPQPHMELSELDAINREYPTMWEDGAGMATLVRSFDGHAPYLTWRLYKLDR